MTNAAVWIGQDFDRRLDALLKQKEEFEMVAALGPLPASALTRLNVLENKIKNLCNEFDQAGIE